MSAATQPKKWRAMTRAILVHGFTASRRPPRPYFDLAPSVTSATSSSAAFVAAVAGSLTINIDQGRARPETVPESRPMTDSCGPNIAARGLTMSLILHAAAQSAFAREHAARSPYHEGAFVTRSSVMLARARHRASTDVDDAPRRARARHTSLTLTSRPPMTRAQIYRF